MRGSNRAGRRGTEPEPQRRRPRPPPWLAEKAVPIFKDLVRHLARMRILGTCDANMLARYASLFVRWQEAEKFVIENGSAFVVRGPARRRADGGEEPGPVVSVKLFPQTRVARDLAGELLRMEDRIGLSPSARARLAGYVEPGPERPMSGILARVLGSPP